ncbi:MarR family winged helix-turn-helix transcriptional regulator [Oricola cellulosilytica]|uniref:MarR family transcriptional regulator n=1 Tax=Oricola cellulosilytica TaxID=1429082 RepID=A0A4R0PCW9_9HYPH|nr:MarR family transcriptional regulator [Oricola cellulosilytica]TCD15321.1 MarR family transcriptional regulator [Oricola cellulosilytica]
MSNRDPSLPASDLIELLFFAYRDFISDPDTILEQIGFGRAHHRVLHFVDRKPGLTVAGLLDLLKITKQSLARVLKQLVDAGYIEQRPGPEDRRQRELYLTPKGHDLIGKLREPQSRRIMAALDQSGCGEEEVARFLYAMITASAKQQIGLLNNGRIPDDARAER